jgi:hypothetical protein
MAKPRDWEEALNQIADEKHMLRCALMDIILTWEISDDLSTFENVIQKGREALTKTDVTQE